MIKKICLTLLLIANISHPLHAMQAKTDDNYQINASLFMLANFTNDSPHYGHLEISKAINPTSLIGVEFLTWQYSNPLGIPYGPSYESPEEAFPGTVKDTGLGVSYQNFFHNQFFYKLHATAFHQSFLDENLDVIQSGFKLFMVARTGYKWTFKKDKFFIEPSIAVTTWPINTNMPEEFQEVEDKWPKYFLFEPGLNIGFRF